MWGIWNTTQRKWVAVSGRRSAFTTGGSDNQFIRKFKDKESAQRECCGNEFPRKIDSNSS